MDVLLIKICLDQVQKLNCSAISSSSVVMFVL